MNRIIFILICVLLSSCGKNDDGCNDGYSEKEEFIKACIYKLESLNRSKLRRNPLSKSTAKNPKVACNCLLPIAQEYTGTLDFYNLFEYTNNLSEDKKLEFREKSRACNKEK